MESPERCLDVSDLAVRVTLYLSSILVGYCRLRQISQNLGSGLGVSRRVHPYKTLVEKFFERSLVRLCGGLDESAIGLNHSLIRVGVNSVPTR
jgi:hypothetical protein